MAKTKATQGNKTTIILSCTCVNEWMDKKYGKNKRVCNPTTGDKMYRCTCCRQEKSL